MDHMLSTAVSLVALAVLVATYVWAHHFFVARTANAYLSAHWAPAATNAAAVGDPTGFATEEERAALQTAFRSAVRTADNHYSEWLWLTLLVAAVAVLTFVLSGGLGVFSLRRNGRV